ncbi:hypothetical protein J6590_021671 [Homalodisca vitripennis]|nr:hypothetical protein J6590_021671 [Homalodisca vitripennis]
MVSIFAARQDYLTNEGSHIVEQWLSESAAMPVIKPRTSKQERQGSGELDDNKVTVFCRNAPLRGQTRDVTLSPLRADCIVTHISYPDISDILDVPLYDMFTRFLWGLKLRESIGYSFFLTLCALKEMTAVDINSFCAQHYSFKAPKHDLWDKPRSSPVVTYHRNERLSTHLGLEYYIGSVEYEEFEGLHLSKPKFIYVA